MKLKVKHTPGPWTVRGRGEGQTFSNRPNHHFRVYAPNHMPVALVSSHELVGGKQESAVAQANARLIAVAPEMAEALRECLQQFFGEYEHREQFIEKYHNSPFFKAEAALQKAGLL